MDAYDSDSSLSDVDAGTSTNVLLGYASTAATDDTFSQLGGEPVSAPSTSLPYLSPLTSYLPQYSHKTP